MPRSARKICDSGVYHIVIRGVNKQTIFYDQNDGKLFLDRLSFVKRELGFEMFAYCLMSNHAHLLIKEPEPLDGSVGATIGKAMHKVLTSYVQWYNRKYERVGHLFQNRFVSEPIETDAYLLQCARYIHQNPLKSNAIVNLGDYDWSSYNSYLGIVSEDRDSLVDTYFISEMLGSSTDDYVRFMNEVVDDSKTTRRFIDVEMVERLTDEKLVNIIKDKFGIDNLYRLNSGDYIERDKNIKQLLTIEGANKSQLSRVSGISIYAIKDYLHRNK